MYIAESSTMTADLFIHPLVAPLIFYIFIAILFLEMLWKGLTRQHPLVDLRNDIGEPRVWVISWPRRRRDKDVVKNKKNE